MDIVKMRKFSTIEEIQVVALGAPLTVAKISEKPASGRKVDKVFSGDMLI